MADLQELYRKLDRLIFLFERLVELELAKTPCTNTITFGPDGEYNMKYPTTGCKPGGAT